MLSHRPPISPKLAHRTMAHEEVGNLVVAANFNGWVFRLVCRQIDARHARTNSTFEIPSHMPHIALAQRFAQHPNVIMRGRTPISAQH